MPRVDAVPLQARLKGLIVDRVDVCFAGSNGLSDIELYKRDTRTVPSTTRKGAPVPENTDPTPEQTAATQKAIDEAVAAAVTKAIADHDAKVAEYLKAEADKPEPELTETQKAVAEAVAVEKAAREKLEADIAKMQDERLTEVLKAKAETVSNVGGVDDIAAVLKAVATGCAPEIGDKLDTILKAAHERLKLSDLTKDTGGRSVEAADSPLGVLKAAAEELRKNDPALSQTDAFKKAAKDDPGTYAQYLDSVRKPAA